MPVPDVVPVLMSRDIFEQTSLRTEDCRPLTIDWGEPDEQGFYTPTFTSHAVDPRIEDGEQEVLFLTSARRVLDAYRRWYTHSSPNSTTVEDDALYMSRTFLRYLSVPTKEEVDEYTGA